MSKNEKDLEKERKSLEKKLSSILSSSTSAKAWSDLLPMTREILQLLSKTNLEIDFSKLSNKLLLAKRLAQCLNPECPSGVHEVVLDIYYVILHNIVFFNETCLSDNLGIYACGLFPFYPNASLNNKKKFMKNIIVGCFLFFKAEELTLCLPGLLTSLIQGLDDNNDETKKDIYTVFNDLTKKVTDNVFYGIYWTLILRNTLLRSSGMKYLLEIIVKYSDYEKMTEEQKKEIIFNEYPNINTVVVNALCQVIEEKDIPTVRTGMDFIITRLPLTKGNNMITDEAKVTLITSALKLLIKNEYSTTRRLKNLILGNNAHDEEINMESEDMIYKIELVVQAFLKIFKPETLFTQEQLMDNLRIVVQFTEQQEELANYILPKIAYNILLCVVHYWQTELNSSEKAESERIIKDLNDFLKKDPHYLKWLWISIANNLSSLNENDIKDKIKNDDEDYDKAFVNLINETLQPLKFSLLFMGMESLEDRIRYYLPIITHLLNLTNKFTVNDRASLEKLRQILLTIYVIIKNLQEPKEQKNENTTNNNIINTTTNKTLSNKSPNNEQNKKDQRDVSVISIFQEVEEEIPDKSIITEEANFENISSKIKKNVLNNFTESIKKFQNFYIDILKKYLEINKDNQITKNEMTIFRQSTQIIIRLQEYAQQEEVPQWVLFLQKLIFDVNINLKLSLEAANHLLDMNMSSFNHHKIYHKIKDDFQNKEIDSNIIDQKYLEVLINKTGVAKNCQELLMGKLYLVLSDQSHQKNIIDLLIKLANFDQVKFLNIIKNTFNIKNFDSTQESMKLFSDFWKLSNEYYNKMIFFKNGECLFNMLDCLDDDNPLLRHLSKSWLNQAYQHFEKILDPIYNILFDDNISTKGQNDQILIEKEYNCVEIRKSFRRLKNMILNSSVLEFLTKMKVTQKSLISKKLCTTIPTYLGLLIGISLRFSQGECIDSLSKEFKRENYSVKASSCEFLEFLLNHIEDKELLLQFAIEINEPIVSLLDKAIVQNDEVMQVQLLSVLKVLYFNSSAVFLKSQDNKNHALSLFKNTKLHDCLVKGMTSDYFYVREKFIKFTVQCLPHFSKVMNDGEGYMLFFKIGGTFVEKLTECVENRIEIEKKGRKDTEKFSQFDTKNNHIIFKNYLDEYKENKRYDENDVLMLVKGLRDILFQLMGSKPNDDDDDTNNENFEMASWVEMKKLLTGNKRTSTGLGNLLSNMFGFDSDSNVSKDGEISSMSKNLFSRQINNLMKCLLLTWINQSDKYEDYDYCLNLNGILPLNENLKLGSLSESDIEINLEIINQNPIKKIVKEISISLFKANPVSFIQTLIFIWFNSKQTQGSKLIMDKQYLLSIIELIISLKIPLNIILCCLGKFWQKKINYINKAQKYKKKKGNKNYITPFDVSLEEAKFFHFIYSYILLNPCLDYKRIYYNNNPNCTEKYESWKEMINLINIVNANSKIIYTTCWLYELLQLFLFKFPLTDIKDNTELKKGLFDIYNSITSKLMDSSFENKTDSIYTGDLQSLVLPFLPHVYYNIIDEIHNCKNLYKKLSSVHQQQDKNENIDNTFLELNENKNNKNTEDLDNMLEASTGKVNEFYRIYLSAAKVSTDYFEDHNFHGLTPEVLNSFYRKVSMITLKANFYKITIGIFCDSQSSIKKQLMEIIKGILGLIKNNKLTNEEDIFFAEISTDFLVSLMKNIPDVLTKCGKDTFINYINDPSFFITTSKMLRNWRKIISISVNHYPELLSDLIKTMGGGFLSLGSSDEDKIKTLRRISFIIYSCEKDIFAKEFEVIKSKVRDLLGGDTKNSKLKDEIFLMMRVLFLRFSHEGVMKMIKDLWPIIFMELIRNIEDPNRNKDIDLVIESFKFIELLSLANVEEFCLYQWNFMLDTYEMDKLDIRNPKSLLSDILRKERVFKPIAAKFLCQEKMLDNITDDLLQINSKGKSELYIIPQKKNYKELFECVRKFFYSIGAMNTYKVPVNYTQIEGVIEKDFLEIIQKKQTNTKK